MTKFQKVARTKIQLQLGTDHTEFLYNHFSTAGRIEYIIGLIDENLKKEKCILLPGGEVKDLSQGELVFEDVTAQAEAQAEPVPKKGKTKGVKTLSD